ncbi:tRNA (adenosine(37)-N6)-threonylcarbamoyltransferase complex dimerization subunit type 1 TsaB [Sandaracinobacteroides hominis]|uniref:tRNA (adenosine(37)-N6)-threonylcarbamoyltransferase complex dimerization subunit type 1 TsaB n=1 Tax=Sandaracinobacteroides hominis TaxID=2780086 RepID=UPI0018F74130|nr:tRNA (adenosine(37)-N6)-threonylcarbamoyltransferase complex dimerization subunit type 1 TsaB [Sandaracinobacteroides hominis]
MPDRIARDTLTGRTLVIATGHELSLALLSDGEVEADHSLSMARGHAEALMPAIAALLEPFGGAAARCDHVVVETGPGSFTGLRVGLAAGRALALAWGAALHGIRSTQLVAAAARNAGRAEELLVALTAPRGQVWVEAFAAGGLQSLGAPKALEASDFDAFARNFASIAGTATCGDIPCFEQSPRAVAVSGLACSYLSKAELLYVRTADSAAA